MEYGFISHDVVQIFSHSTNEAMRRAQDATNKVIEKAKLNENKIVEQSVQQSTYVTELENLNMDLRTESDFILRAKRYLSSYYKEMDKARRQGDKSKIKYYQEKRDEMQEKIAVAEVRIRNINEAIDRTKKRETENQGDIENKIEKSSSMSRKCARCIYLSGKTCSVHMVKLKRDNVCSQFKTEWVKVYNGGRVSPR